MHILRKLFICLALSLVVANLQPAAAQSFKWWQQEKFQKGANLTPEQVARIEAIFQTAEPSFRAQKAALDKAEHRLSKVIQDAASDEATVLQAAERVEAARAELSRTRTLHLFRTRRVLTDEQNAKIKEIHENDRRTHDRDHDRKPKGDFSHDSCD